MHSAIYLVKNYIGNIIQHSSMTNTGVNKIDSELCPRGNPGMY